MCRGASVRERCVRRGVSGIPPLIAHRSSLITHHSSLTTSHTRPSQHAVASLNTKLWNAHMNAQELAAAVERAATPAVAAPAPSSAAEELAEARQAYFGAYVTLMKTNLFADGVTFTATQQEVIDEAMSNGVGVSDFPKWTLRFFQRQ